MRTTRPQRHIPALTPHPRTTRQSTIDSVAYWKGMAAVAIIVLVIVTWSAHVQIQELRAENATLAAQR